LWYRGSIDPLGIKKTFNDSSRFSTKFRYRYPISSALRSPHITEILIKCLIFWKEFTREETSSETSFIAWAKTTCFFHPENTSNSFLWLSLFFWRQTTLSFWYRQDIFHMKDICLSSLSITRQMILLTVNNV
jgi:hypothetical protein